MKFCEVPVKFLINPFKISRYKRLGYNEFRAIAN